MISKYSPLALTPVTLFQPVEIKLPGFRLSCNEFVIDACPLPDWSTAYYDFWDITSGILLGNISILSESNILFYIGMDSFVQDLGTMNNTIAYSGAGFALHLNIHDDARSVTMETTTTLPRLPLPASTRKSTRVMA
jgi:hypothetical protein